MRVSILRPLPIPIKHIAIAFGVFWFLLVIDSFVTAQLHPMKFFFPSVDMASPASNYLTWLILIKLVYSNVYYQPIKKGQSLWIIGKHLMLALLIITVHFVISNVVYYSYFYTLGMGLLPKIEDPNEAVWLAVVKMIARGAPSEFIFRFIEYSVLVVAFIAIDLNRQYHRKILELSNMEKELNMAHLKALRMQLRPHFLFNTLNSISSLMDSNVLGAQTVLARLGGMLRKTLTHSNESMTSLRDELKYIENYLEIEQIRFSDRLQIKYDIGDDVLDELVPSMVLQPIVENAIKHGFGSSVEECTIKLIAKKENENLVLTVQDNGNGTPDVAKILSNPGVGVANTVNRLKAIYPNQHKVQILSPGGKGLIFTITIRLNKD